MTDHVHTKRYVNKIDEKYKELLEEIEDWEFDPPDDLATTVNGRSFSPDDWGISDHRIRMMAAFETGGIPMLVDYIFEYAEEKYDNGDLMFKYFAEDKVLPDPVMPFLLHTIHPQIIKALISGTLTQRHFSDNTFNGILDRTCKFFSTPGIYINIFHRKETDNTAFTQAGSPPPDDPDAGKGFTIEELQRLTALMKLYLRGYGIVDANSAKLATQIDHNPNPGSGRWLHVNGERRYCESDHQEATIKGWIEVTEKFIRRAVQDKGDLDRHLCWCIVSVGYGVKCSMRRHDHVDNESTSKLFGLFNAIRIQHFRNYDIHQRQILHICDAAHCNLAEALVSVLSSSYSDEGGLNGKRAGAVDSIRAAAQEYFYYQNVGYVLDNPNHHSVVRNEENTRLKMGRIKRLISLREEDYLEQGEKRKEEVKKQVEDVRTLAARVDAAECIQGLADLWATTVGLEYEDKADSSNREVEGGNDSGGDGDDDEDDDNGSGGEGERSSDPVGDLEVDDENSSSSG